MAASSTSLFLLTLIHLILGISARDFLSAGSSLSVEHSSDVLRSPDGTFSCGFYNISPNASTFSIWFSESIDRTVVWSANPLHPVYTWGSRVKLQTDGSMVLKDYNGQIVWTSNVSVSDAEHVQAQLQDTGNLIVKGKGGTILWQSFDSPTDTLLPTQTITATKKLVSTNRLLDPGQYSFHFDDQYLLSLFYDQKDISLIYWPNPTRNIWDKLRMPFNSTTTGAVDNLGHFLGSDNATFTASDWGLGWRFLSSAKCVVCAAEMGYVFIHLFLPVRVPLVLKSSIQVTGAKAWKRRRRCWFQLMKLVALAQLGSCN